MSASNENIAAEASTFDKSFDSDPGNQIDALGILSDGDGGQEIQTEGDSYQPTDDQLNGVLNNFQQAPKASDYEQPTDDQFQTEEEERVEEASPTQLVADSQEDEEPVEEEEPQQSESEEMRMMREQFAQMQGQLQEMQRINTALLQGQAVDEQKAEGSDEQKSARDIMQDLDIDFDLTDDQFEEAMTDKDAMARILTDNVKKGVTVAIQKMQQLQSQSVKSGIQDFLTVQTGVSQWLTEHQDELNQFGADAMMRQTINELYNRDALQADQLDSILNSSWEEVKGLAQSFQKTQQPPARRGAQQPRQAVTPTTKGRAKSKQTNTRQEDGAKRMEEEFGDLSSFQGFNNL